MPDVCATNSLPSYDQALSEVLGRVAVLDTERVPLAGALGRVLRESIVADRDQPPFNRSAMDGFAVRSVEVVSNKWFDIVATIPAGGMADASTDLTRGVCAIATGAAVPDEYDAVIPIELTRQEGGRVCFEAGEVKAGENIHPRGVDALAGCELIGVGRVLGPQQIGLAAAVGCIEPVVTRRPSVSLLTTGDEVRPPATLMDSLTPVQIRNSNGPMLDALLAALGAERMDHAHVPDDADITLAVLREAESKSDLIITVGGVSAGRRDHVPWAVGEMGYQTLIKGVAIQPGKPVFIAQAGDGSSRFVVGLPGNPVSVLATAHLFVWPMLRKMAGLESALPWRRVLLDEPVRPNARREAFRSATITGDGYDRARVIPWRGSGDLSHTAHANGLLRLPTRDNPLEANEPAWFLPLIGGGLS